MIDVAALVITFNERENIERLLSALSRVPQVVVVDSGSTDGTLEIARSMRPDIKVVTRLFDSFAQQCNFGLAQLKTEWVLSLDADYILTPEIVAEIAELQPSDDTAGYVAGFNYCVHGSRLRSTLYPQRTVLYRRRLAEYRDEGHGHRVQVGGRLVSLNGKIDHDDRKPLSRWIQAQDRYMTIEARHLLERQKAEWSERDERHRRGAAMVAEESGMRADHGRSQKEGLKFQDRLRLKIFFAAPIMFLYLLFARGLVLDGWPGWYYVAQRTLAELLLSLRLLTERHHLEDTTSTIDNQ